ncbi:MAG: phosphoribosylpyrophosphate synthetase [Chitinophagaceae bacterium]
MRNYESLNDAISDLESRGYTESFEEDQYCLYCQDLRLRITPEEFIVDEVHRFGVSGEGGGRCTLYAISSGERLKGVLVDDSSKAAD